MKTGSMMAVKTLAKKQGFFLQFWEGGLSDWENKCCKPLNGEFVIVDNLPSKN